MRNFAVSLSVAILACGVALTSQPANADSYTNKSVEQGPAQVVDSWMQPTVVRSRAIKDADGSVSQTVEEPLIMERHERVMIPTTETTTTTDVIQQPPTVVRTEKSQVAVSEVKAPARPKKRYVAHKRTHKKSKSRVVAHKIVAPAKQKYVVQKEVVETQVSSPTVVQHTEQSVHKETLIERPDPALGAN